mmetsp:Transcript_29421/g.40637  ORF Transcript_29421/g.40637 Transcript_29421/m.40637 type:complete len:230 (+) Transcript_29421:57-746(+)
MAAFAVSKIYGLKNHALSTVANVQVNRKNFKTATSTLKLNLEANSCNIFSNKSLVINSKFMLKDRRRSEVVCMAHPKRVARVQQQIKREVSTLFLTDKRIRSAIYPNEALGADYALSSLATVTDLNLTNDLQVAKVYVSVYADEETKVKTLEALQKLEGYTRKKIGERVRLRLTPEVRYILDDSYIRATKVLSLLEKLDVERQTRSNVVEFDGVNLKESEDDDEVLVIN